MAIPSGSNTSGGLPGDIAIANSSSEFSPGPSQSESNANREALETAGVIFMDQNSESPMSHFEFHKICRHGTENPIVARLALQTMHISNVLGRSERENAHLLGLYLNAQQRLLQCHDCAKNLESECERAVNEAIEHRRQGYHSRPHMIDLQKEAETFVLAARHYICHIASICDDLFGSEFRDTHEVFCVHQGGKISFAVEWATGRFSNEDRLTKLFQTVVDPISELIRKRNAVEHPGGKSGTLFIQNLREGKEGIILPKWGRQGENSCENTDLFADLTAYLKLLLEFGESLLALAFEKSEFSKALTIVEIPEEHRDPAKPERFKFLFRNLGANR